MKFRMLNSNRQWLIIIAAIFLFNGTLLSNQTRDTELKAVLIEKIVSYIKWSNSFSEQDEIVIGVYKNNDFYKVVQRVYKNRKILGKPVRIKNVNGSDNITEANILFFSEIPKSELLENLMKISNKPILTFGDQKGFNESGVHVNFQIKNGYMRFELNVESLKRSGFFVQPTLIELSKK